VACRIAEAQLVGPLMDPCQLFGGVYRTYKRVVEPNEKGIEAGGLPRITASICGWLKLPVETVMDPFGKPVGFGETDDKPERCGPLLHLGLFLPIFFRPFS